MMGPSGPATPARESIWERKLSRPKCISVLLAFSAERLLPRANDDGRSQSRKFPFNGPFKQDASQKTQLTETQITWGEAVVLNLRAKTTGAKEPSNCAIVVKAIVGGKHFV